MWLQGWKGMFSTEPEFLPKQPSEDIQLILDNNTESLGQIPSLKFCQLIKRNHQWGCRALKSVRKKIIGSNPLLNKRCYKESPLQCVVKHMFIISEVTKASISNWKDRNAFTMRTKTLNLQHKALKLSFISSK